MNDAKNNETETERRISRKTKGGDYNNEEEDQGARERYREEIM